MRITLHVVDAGNTLSVADEVFSSFSSTFSSRIDQMDAVKMPNINENLAIENNGQAFMVDRRSPLRESDTTALRLWNTTPNSYVLEFKPANLASLGLSAYLEDYYLRTSTPVRMDEVTQVPFSVNAEAASSAPDRFRLVYKTRNAPPTDLTATDKQVILAYPNPIVNRSITLNFMNQARGRYQVVLTNSIGQVVFRKEVQHTGGSAVQNLQLERKLPQGVYQLKVKGETSETNIQLFSN
jgi:hypothetical protein